MERPLHDMPGARKNPWIVRGAVLAVAALPIISFLIWTPASWWKQNGFLSYPGTFVRLADNHYRLCRPWPKAGWRGEQLSGRVGWITGKGNQNLAVLLPAGARITAIYCGAAPAQKPLSECTNAHCPESVRALVDDSVYTKGRGVIFNVWVPQAAPATRTVSGWRGNNTGETRVSMMEPVFHPERLSKDIVFRLWGFEHEEPKMRKFHAMTLAAASAVFLAAGGAAMAQTVSSGNSSYDQGYADGAAAQKQNTLNAFQSGMAAGQTQPDQSAISGQSFDNGYQAGQAQASADKQNAYNNGYHDKAVEQNDTNNRAFENGFRAGATEQAHLDDDFP
jgi:hypothetical protein